jgi:DNA-directed RNA polymerase subunit beta'
MSELTHNNNNQLNNYENRFLFGTKIIYNWLCYFDYNFQLSNLERQIRFHIFEIKEEIKEFASVIFIYFFELKNFSTIQKKIKRLHWEKNKLFRRLRLIIHFRQAKIQPKWMILSVLPVLPPDLRPIVELGSSKVAVSDINKSYQTILLRNLRLKKFYNNISFNNFTEEVRYTKRLLQESVDELIYQNKSSKKNNNTIKSLSSILKGKRGRFRQNLLGKRVDYSGRSVIVVDPKLKLHECGIPLKMAIELFQPFLIKYLITNKLVRTIPGAKQLISTHNKLILSAIRSVLTNYLVLLNRAPTLHKLGIQAFQPILVSGKAICLHPLVCPAFNADFDGDQMGLHIPLSFESQAEAWKLLWSRNNLLLSAMGTPVLTPGQDVVLGCYYLTSLLKSFSLNYYLIPKNFSNTFKYRLYFKNFKDVLKAYYQQKINIHTEIWINCINNFLLETQNPDLNSIKICKNQQICYKYEDYELYYNSKGYQVNQFIKTTVGRIIFNDFIHTIVF